VEHVDEGSLAQPPGAAKDELVPLLQCANEMGLVAVKVVSQSSVFEVLDSKTQIVNRVGIKLGVGDVLLVIYFINQGRLRCPMGISGILDFSGRKLGTVTNLGTRGETPSRKHR